MAESKTVQVTTPQGTKVTCDPKLAESLGWSAGGSKPAAKKTAAKKSSK